MSCCFIDFGFGLSVGFVVGLGTGWFGILGRFPSLLGLLLVWLYLGRFWIVFHVFWAWFIRFW